MPTSVRAFVPADLPDLVTWWRAHGVEPFTLDQLPSDGGLVPGVAAAFLYRTNSDLALLDTYVTNPAAPGYDRFRAMHAITEYLLAKGERLGHRRLAAFSTVPLHVEQAHVYGLKNLGTFVVLGKKV